MACLTRSGMILVLGDNEDSFAVGIYDRIRQGHTECRFISETDLFASVGFASRPGSSQLKNSPDSKKSAHSNEYLRWDAFEVPLACISGMIVRLNRTWWPSVDFSLKDQMFIYHETMASWFSVLFSRLNCPIVNRFGLGWWLNDLSYPEVLRRRLSSRLRLGMTPLASASPFTARLWPTRAVDRAECVSVYIANKEVIPRNSEAASVAQLLSGSGPELDGWRLESGLNFCRLDFENNGDFRLAYVEPYPLIEGESEELVRQLTGAMAEVFT